MKSYPLICTSLLVLALAACTKGPPADNNSTNPVPGTPSNQQPGIAPSNRPTFPVGIGQEPGSNETHSNSNNNSDAVYDNGTPRR